jgi:hypothetical protein
MHANLCGTTPHGRVRVPSALPPSLRLGRYGQGAARTFRCRGKGNVGLSDLPDGRVQNAHIDVPVAQLCQCGRHRLHRPAHVACGAIPRPPHTHSQAHSLVSTHAPDRHVRLSGPPCTFNDDR